MGRQLEETGPLSEGQEPESISRRQLLTAAAAGGAALVVGGLGGAAVGGMAARAEAEAKLAVARADYELELTKLRALVALYEQLEKIGIDAVVATGMNVVSGILSTLRSGVNLLRDGITAAENALTALHGMIEGLRGQFNQATQALDDLMQRFRAAEGPVGAVVGTAQPLGDAIASFFSENLARLPFGVGERFQRAFDALGALIKAIPTAVQAVTLGLVKSVADTFFPATGTSAVQTGVLSPIKLKLLEPLNGFLRDVDKLLTTWDRDFTTPVRAALDERQQVRNQITDYRRQNKV